MAHRIASTLLVLACLRISGCSECDVRNCERACDEEYPNDESARSACYDQCADAYRDCLDRGGIDLEEPESSGDR